MTYNPEQWLMSTFRSLNHYLSQEFNESVKYNGEPKGLEVYEIIDGFPSSDAIRKKMPLTKTLIHFEVDDINSNVIGFGDNIFRDNYNATEKFMQTQEAKMHRINFDIGIWSSDRSGGTTARLRAYEILTLALWGSKAQLAIEASEGTDDGRLEIINFSGGRFITEAINDLPVYRVVDLSLEFRVYSRTPLPPESEATATIEEILQDADLSTQDNQEIS